MNSTRRVCTDRTEWRTEDGKLHRDDGPAVEYADGTQVWYINGQKHREDGPAYIIGGTSYWYKYGKIHREDGPAIECDTGEKYYYLENTQVLPEALFTYKEKRKPSKKIMVCACGPERIKRQIELD
jgi:hypothetical protein